MRARVGKIARLPAAIREELNRHLDNGALGRELVPWLNALPEVQRVLAARFAGRLITEDNLSEWRRGGFQDWRREEERRIRLRELADPPDPDARELDSEIEERLVVEFAEELERLSALADPAERFKRLTRLSREFCRVQRIRNRSLEVGLLEVRSRKPAQTKSNLNSPRIGPSRTFSDKKHKGGGVGH